MAESSPTVRQRRLGKELARLRTAAGKTQVEAASYVGTRPTSISKFENFERTPPVPHLKLMLQFYGVDLDSTQAAGLIQLAEQARERGWWAEFGEAVPDWFEDYLGLETAASEVWTYEAEYVPGLLQNAHYTQALTREITPGNPFQALDGFAAVRARRQRRLVEDEPLTLRAVINEAVLLREPVGGPEVMREQLAALLDAAQRPHITLQVLPFEVGTHPGMHGSFTMLRFAEESSMNTVYVELRGGAVYLDSLSAVELHSVTFEALEEIALSPEETISLIRETERRL